MAVQKHILIVDDDRNILVMLRSCLNGGGYLLQTAANGRDALAIIQRATPDLMLLDLAMPVMDGMTLLTWLHEMPRDTTPRVVVMTAHGSVKTAIQAIRLGASDFLEKPFTPADVRLSIASVLEEPRNGEEPADDYEGVLRSVRVALRAGTLRAAEILLMRAGMITDNDPAFLNLAGVLHETHGRVDSARRFYKKAAMTDAYPPALENLARLDELSRTGKTNRTVAFGDIVDDAAPLR